MATKNSLTLEVKYSRMKKKRVFNIEHRSPDETQAVDSHAILEALDKTGWNKAKAARLLGIDRVTLYRKIKRYNLTQDTP